MPSTGGLRKAVAVHGKTASTKLTVKFPRLHPQQAMRGQSASAAGKGYFVAAIHRFTQLFGQERFGHKVEGPFANRLRD